MDTEPNGATILVLQAIHPDPFTQAAIWRLYRTAPECLSTGVQIAMAQANPPTTTIQEN